MPALISEEFEQLEHFKAREQHIFFVVETSSALQGEPILEINNAICAALEELKKVNEVGIEICIGILEYNDIARWSECHNKARKLDYLRDFVWEDLYNRGGRNLGETLRTLEWELSRKTKMESAGGNYRPIVIFMSDGRSVDDWEPGLQALSENKWYRYAIKIAFAVGWYPREDVLTKIVNVGVPGITIAVSKYEDLSELSRIVVAASVKGNYTMRNGGLVENLNEANEIMCDIADAVKQAGYGAVCNNKLIQQNKSLFLCDDDSFSLIDLDDDAFGELD